VSIDEIHTETRIARTLIESFEEGELYDHPTYNRVYLRSFIKAYADAVEISRERALQALDGALNGTYQHELAQEYLSGEASAAEPTSEESDEDASSSSSEAPPEGPTAGGPEGRGGIVGPPRAVGRTTLESPPREIRLSRNPTSRIRLEWRTPIMSLHPLQNPTSTRETV
jgi:hypothetical protein